jgi:outer membrane protein OmpA-like peptidoglycan-associated protein
MHDVGLRNMMKLMVLGVAASFTAACGQTTVGNSEKDFGWRVYNTPGPMGLTGPGGPQGAAAMAPPPVVREIKQDWQQFSNVTFDLDKADIRPDERDKIKAVADFLEQNPRMEVGLAGYTDPQGTYPHNMKLSDQRTKAVTEALAEAGVPKDRVRTVALASRDRNCTQNTEDCYAQNRRVEFYFRPR